MEPEEVQLPPESDTSAMSVSDVSTSSALAGSARTRRSTPAERRVKWHDMTVTDNVEDERLSGDDNDPEGTLRHEEAAGSRAPVEALLAMRTSASLPEATQDTKRLLDQLEAHLAATSAAAELHDMPSPIRAAEAKTP